MWITYRVGRDAGTGRFIPLASAKRRKKNAVTQAITYWRAPRKKK